MYQITCYYHPIRVDYQLLNSSLAPRPTLKVCFRKFTERLVAGTLIVPWHGEVADDQAYCTWTVFGC